MRLTRIKQIFNITNQAQALKNDFKSKPEKLSILDIDFFTFLILPVFDLAETSTLNKRY